MQEAQSLKDAKKNKVMNSNLRDLVPKKKERGRPPKKSIEESQQAESEAQNDEDKTKNEQADAEDPINFACLKP